MTPEEFPGVIEYRHPDKVKGLTLHLGQPNDGGDPYLVIAHSFRKVAMGFKTPDQVRDWCLVRGAKLGSVGNVPKAFASLAPRPTEAYDSTAG